MNSKAATIPLLPHRAKTVGLLLIGGALAYGLAQKAGLFTLGTDDKQLARTLAMSLLLLGLLLVACARDRVDHEERLALRIRALVQAFIWGALYVLLHPLSSFIVGGLPTPQTGADAVLMMLFAYFAFFYLGKWRGR